MYNIIIIILSSKYVLTTYQVPSHNNMHGEYIIIILNRLSESMQTIEERLNRDLRIIEHFIK